MIYEGTLCVLQSPKTGDINLIKDLPFHLECSKKGMKSYVEILIQTDRYNKENVSIENIFLIGQQLNLDKNEVSKILGKIKKENPKEMLGFRPSKRNRMISNFYEKYFQELNSYGVSLISLKQLYDGHFFNLYKTVVAKDIIEIPSDEIPKIIENNPVSKKRKNYVFSNKKHSLNFILNENNTNDDIIANKSPNEIDDELTDSGELITSEKRIKLDQRNKISNVLDLTDRAHPAKNDNKNPIQNTSVISHFTNVTYNLFLNSRFADQLKEYIPIDDLNLFQQNFDTSYFNASNISIHYKKDYPVFYHLENKKPNFDNFPPQTKFLNISTKKDNLFTVELTIKFDIPSNKVISLFDGHHDIIDIRAKSKIIFQETAKNPQYGKIFKYMKLLFGYNVIVIPILIDIIDF